jgi:predicted PurR-regulated permease PerM
MLVTREEWIDRLVHASTVLGLRPRRGELLKVQHEMVTYIGFMALVSLGYMILVSLCLWAIGVPQPLLWA